MSKLSSSLRLSSSLTLAFCVTVFIACTKANGTEPGAVEIFKRSQDARLVFVVGDHYRLDEGSIICAPKVKTTIDTDLCQVTVKPHSAALISREVDLVRVIDLYDWRVGCIHVQCGQETKAIGPGGEISVITAGNSAEAEAVLLADNVHRRKVKIGKVPDRQFMIQDQISMMDVALKSPLLQELHHSTNKAEKRMFEKIIKTIAALSLTEATDAYSIWTPKTEARH